MLKIFVLLAFISVSNCNYYELLGITKDADDRQIRLAFKKLVVALHPDKNKDPEASEKFLKVTKAYEVLKNVDSRKNYDLYGEEKSGAQKPQYYSWSYYSENFGIYDADENIVTLNKHTYDQNVRNTKKTWFVNFYSPMCSHCHHLAPDWRLLATYLQDVIKIGAVNCEDDWTLCREEGIHSYPSLVLYPSREKFNGDRVKDELVDFVLDRLKSKIYQIDKNYWSSTVVNRNTNWLLILCREREKTEGNCLSKHHQLMLSSILEGMSDVGFVDCDSYKEICDNFDTNSMFVFMRKHSQSHYFLNKLDIREVVEKVLEFLPSIKELDPSDLENLSTRFRVGSNIVLLVYFYMGKIDKDHEFELKKYEANIQLNFPLGQFNCGRYSSVCKQLYIQHYPVLKMFKNGGVENYHGGIIADDMLLFALQSYRAKNCRSLTPDEFPAVLHENDPGLWLIDFYAPWCPPCMKLLPELRKASEQLDLVSFGTIDCTVHTRLCQSYNIRSYPTTMFYNRSKSTQYHGEHKSVDILDFLENMLTPLVQELTGDNFYQLVGEKLSSDVWIVDYYVPWCNPCQKLGPEWRKLARKIQHIPNVYIGQVNCEDEGDLCSQQAIRSYPTIRLYPFGGVGLSTVAIYSAHQRDSSSLMTWLFSFLPSSTVVNLTPEDFKSKVISDTGPWLVDFYTPWCGACVHYEPEFRAIAKALEGEVTCGKVDCSQYEMLCRQLGVTMYPTVLLYRGTKLDPWQNEEYRGEELDNRHIDSIIVDVRQLLVQDDNNVHDEL